MTSTAGPDVRTAPPSRRWAALAVIAGAQLMTAIDAFIVNIALPDAARDLQISPANVQWVITAYTVTFGGLLLLGGRIADFAGRKRTFIIGLIGFALASALGGIAQDQLTLFAARGLQGLFAALLAPAALALITVTFTEPRERAKAFGVYGAVSGGGAAIGLILGGILTEYTSWRWTLLINTPIAIVLAIGAIMVVRESRAVGEKHYDVAGAVLITLSLFTLVFGLSQASESGWDSVLTLGLIAVGIVLMIAFVVVEANIAHPLLPLRVLLDRDRGTSFATAFLMGSALIVIFLFLTFYFQQTLMLTPLQSGFAFLPFSIGLIVSAAVCSTILPRVGPKLPMLIGLLMAIVGVYLLTFIGVDTSWWTHVLPAELLISFGFGQVFVPLASTALTGIKDEDAGIASALVNTTQQIGASVGTALLTTIATAVALGYVVPNGPGSEPAGTVVGYHAAFFWAMGGLILALVLVAALMRPGRGAAHAPSSPIAAAGEPFEPVLPAEPAGDAAPTPTGRS